MEHITGSRIAIRTRTAALVLVLCAAGTLNPAFAALAEAEAAMQKQDFKTAAKEWTALADKGDAHAQSTLAMMYSAGLGVQKDAAKAYALNRKAAEQKHARTVELESPAAY